MVFISFIVLEKERTLKACLSIRRDGQRGDIRRFLKSSFLRILRGPEPDSAGPPNCELDASFIGILCR